jgi:hypothetical protein
LLNGSPNILMRRTECAAETNLNELLDGLPDVPVPSNFHRAGGPGSLSARRLFQQREAFIF